MSSPGQVGFAAFAVALAALAACAAPVPVTPVPDGNEHGDPSIATAEPDSVRLMLQVREYPQSAEVVVVAWDLNEPDYGLRVAFRRDGTMIRDHLFYVSTDHPPLGGPDGRPRIPSRYVQTVAPAGRALRLTSVRRDAHSCQGTLTCSPKETFAVMVPDDVLRANRDSISLRLTGRAGTDLILSVRRAIIDPYLAKADSVSAALSRR